jgi:hypothetical protein
MKRELCDAEPIGLTPQLVQGLDSLAVWAGRPHDSRRDAGATQGDTSYELAVASWIACLNS